MQIAIVIGGGNILRGAQFTAGNSSIQEATAHYMGMLATVINGLALQDALESLDCQTRLMSALRMDGVAEPFIDGILKRSRLYEAALIFKIATRRVNRLNSPRPQELSAMLREITSCLSSEEGEKSCS